MAEKSLKESVLPMKSMAMTPVTPVTVPSRAGLGTGSDNTYSYVFSPHSGDAAQGGGEEEEMKMLKE